MTRREAMLTTVGGAAAVLAIPHGGDAAANAVPFGNGDTMWVNAGRYAFEVPSEGMIAVRDFDTKAVLKHGDRWKVEARGL